MQALQKKQAEEQKLRDLLANDATRTIEERVEHCRIMQYEEHKGLFAISHSSIHKAAADGSIDGLKFFLAPNRRPKVKINDFDASGNCPMHCAAIRGRVHSINFLVENGSSVDVRSTYDDTPLMLACKEGQVNVVKLLFDLGSNISLVNRAGYNAAHYAAQADAVDPLILLVDLVMDRQQKEELERKDKEGDVIFSEDSTSLASLSRNEDDSLSIVSSQTEQCINAELAVFLNQIATNGSTPLQVACLNDSRKVLAFLLEMRVRVDVQDKSGDTALHKAGRMKNRIIYDMLKDGGASENIRNIYEETARDLMLDNPSY